MNSNDQLKAPPGGKAFPELKGHWLRGCLREMQRDPLSLYSNARRDLGDCIRMQVVKGIDCYILTHPDAVEHVLHRNHKNYRKPDIFSKNVALLVGQGLFTNEGESWRSQRRLAQPAFHSQSIAGLGPSIVRGAEAFVERQRRFSGQAVDLSEGMMRLGLGITSSTLFSTDISGESDQIGRAFRIAFSHISDRLNSLQLVPTWFPTPANRTFMRSKKMLDRVVAQLVEAHKRNPAGPHDLLTMLLDARDPETGLGMPDRLLMDEVLTLLAGGHENIGAALTWTWYLLALHQEDQEAVFAQIHARLGGRSPTVDDVPHLPLLRSAFEESMRLYPPGWGELRETIDADQVQGFGIPPRSMIILCQWVTHRHPDFWVEPERFNVRRFLASESGKHHRFAYFPFGGGPRICIGMQLALLEGSLILATILQQFRVRLVPVREIIPDASFTLRPRDGLMVVLEPRGKAS